MQVELVHASAGEGLVDNAASSPDNRECRFCLRTERADLIAPCQCAGSSKWVHRHCLDRWRANGGPHSFTHCPTCQFAYILELKRAPTEFEQLLRQHCHRLVGRAVNDFVQARWCCRHFCAHWLLSSSSSTRNRSWCNTCRSGRHLVTVTVAIGVLCGTTGPLTTSPP